MKAKLREDFASNAAAYARYHRPQNDATRPARDGVERAPGTDFDLNPSISEWPRLKGTDNDVLIKTMRAYQGISAYIDKEKPSFLQLDKLTATDLHQFDPTIQIESESFSNVKKSIATGNYKHMKLPKEFLSENESFSLKDKFSEIIKNKNQQVIFLSPCIYNSQLEPVWGHNGKNSADRQNYKADQFIDEDLLERINIVPTSKISLTEAPLIARDLVDNIDNKAYINNTVAGREFNAKLTLPSDDGDDKNYLKDAICKEMTLIPDAAFRDTATIIARRQVVATLAKKNVADGYESESESALLENMSMLSAHIGTLKPLRAFDNLPERLPRENDTVIHGTNLWSIVSSAKFADGHLLAGDEQILVSPLTTSTGESAGKTPLNREYVSTVRTVDNGRPLRFLDLQDCIN